MAVSSPSVFYAKGCARLLIMVAGFNRLPKPLHREFDVRRLHVTPAFNLRLISVFGVTLKIFLGQFPSGRLLPGEISRGRRGLGASLAICVDNPH
jgi:hypothetical protein